jgi:hypothetical protein
VYERAKVLIAREKPDTVITFNGRFATSRPIVAASGLAGVPLLRHERGSTFERYELFTDAIHNYAYIRERIAERWRQADTASRETQGHEFYRRRRGGDGIGWRSYTSSQDRGRVPPLIPGKRRLVYFTSSDDEYAAVTDAYVPGHWPDQFSAVGALMRASSRQPDIELVIRVHPHLEIKSVAERARWNAVAKNGATIIAADDPVDTYALVDSADIVASYGSTIGMEAVYWGKPVILVGPCSYAGSPAVHEPRDEAALESLLSPGRQLPRPDPALCLPYGYYYLTYGTRYQYYSPESLFEGKFLGHRLEWDNPLIRSLRSVGVGRLYQRLMQAWR